jgi:nucleotide-binding universal stress UspA family protein
MGSLVIAAVDGSEHAIVAARQGLELLGGSRDVVLVSAIESVDPMLVTGTGMAGGTMSTETYEQTNALQEEEGRRIVIEAAAALGIEGSAELRVERGNPGPTLCELAGELEADAIVVGSRGHGGLKRAVLGSVSDHVVRNAPCPVVVVGSQAQTDDD